MFEELKDYLNKRLYLLKLESVELGARLTAKLIKGAIIGMVILMLLLMISFAAAFTIGTYLNNLAYGYLIVAGFYALILALLLLFKHALIERPVQDAIARMAFKSKSDKNPEH